eukprot:679922-Alexandrium_andersonii.AAC.1
MRRVREARWDCRDKTKCPPAFSSTAAVPSCRARRAGVRPTLDCRAHAEGAQGQTSCLRGARWCVCAEQYCGWGTALPAPSWLPHAARARQLAPSIASDVGRDWPPIMNHKQYQKLAMLRWRATSER